MISISHLFSEGVKFNINMGKVPGMARVGGGTFGQTRAGQAALGKMPNRPPIKPITNRTKQFMPLTY